MSGVIIGAALCCLPGATLGSIYDDWQASKEAPEMERRARQHQAELQTQRRCVVAGFQLGFALGFNQLKLLMLAAAPGYGAAWLRLVLLRLSAWLVTSSTRVAAALAEMSSRVEVQPAVLV